MPIDGDVKGLDGKGNTDGNWYDALPTDVHEHVKGYDTAEAMVRGSIENKSKIPVIPENKDGYKQKVEDGAKPLEGDALKSDEALVTQIKGYAEAVGMTQDQFTKAVVTARQAAGKREENKQKAIQAGVDTLKKNWGEDFEANFKKADAFAGKFFSEDFMGVLKKTGIDHNHQFITGIFELSKLVSEDSSIKNGDLGNNKDNENVGKDGIRRDPATGLPMLKYNKPKE